MMSEGLEENMTGSTLRRPSMMAFGPAVRDVTDPIDGGSEWRMNTYRDIFQR